ncbi:MAG: hypothetical protein IE909_14180 [Campylobacterales bacterium]|nr:hypothetical protein [Campylobacterales bacterium]
MAYTKVTISLSEEMNNRWNAVSKKLKISKSLMVQEFLDEVIPILEHEAPRDIMAHAMKHMGKSFNDIGELLKNDENDEDKK